MEIKKSTKANLNQFRLIFFEVGLVLVFFLLWNRFEHKTGEVEVEILDSQMAAPLEAEEAPITRQEELKPPPPPPPRPQVVEEIIIKEDDAEIENEVEMEDTEVDENTEVEIVEIEDEEEAEEIPIFVVVEEMPEFPGGQLELRKHIANSVEYPEIAREMDIQGRVFVEFVVDERGKVINAKVVRSVHPALDKEALRVINSLPTWKPGKQRGKPARVKFTLPINFKLNK